MKKFRMILLLALFSVSGFAAEAVPPPEEFLVGAELKESVNNWKQEAVKGAKFDYNAESGAPMLQIFANTVLSPAPAWRVAADAAKLAAFPAEKELELAFTANTGGDPSVKFRASVNFLKGGQSVAAPAKEMTIYAGWEKETLRFKRPADAFDAAEVKVELLTSGRLRIYDFHLTAALPLPTASSAKTIRDFARVLDFPSRNTYWNSQPKTVTVEGFAPGDTLKITLAEIGGKTCQSWEWSVPVREKFTRKLALPVLAPGAYELTIVAEAGDETLTEVELFRIRKGNPQQGVTFNEERYMRIDGKPFFPIGLTHTPVDDPDKFRVYAASGINMVNVFELDVSQSWFNYYRKVFTDNNLAMISWDNFSSRYNGGTLEQDAKRRAEAFAKFPKFIGFMDDESAWLNSSIKRVREVNAMLFKYAPDYVIWGNNAPRVSYDPDAAPRRSFAHLKRYYRTYDVTGIDIYPVPAGKVGMNDLPNQTISAVGDYTDIANQIGQNHLPIWMCLQAYAWGEQGGRTDLEKWPRPNYDELRFMAYNAITHGATGIVWHSEGGKGGHGPTDEVYDEWWQSFADVNRELAVVGQFLSAGKHLDLPRPPEEMRWLARQNDQERLLIAVNESAKEKSFQNPLAGTFYLSPKGIKAAKVEKLPPYSAAILSTRPITIAPTPRFTPQPHNFKTGVPCKGKFTLDADYLMAPPGWGCFTARFPVTLPEAPKKACIRITAQREWVMNINGEKFPDRSYPEFVYGNWYFLFEYDLTNYLKAGENHIDVQTWAGYLACEIEIDGKIVARTDAQTAVSRNGRTDWVKGRSAGRMGTVKDLRVPLCRMSDCR